MIEPSAIALQSSSLKYGSVYFLVDRLMFNIMLNIHPGIRIASGALLISRLHDHCRPASRRDPDSTRAHHHLRRDSKEDLGRYQRRRIASYCLFSISIYRGRMDRACALLMHPAAPENSDRI